MSKLSDFKQQINALRYNPAGIQRKSLELLERVNGLSDQEEIDIVDPSNPFVFLMEASAINASAAMSEAEAVSRQLYPSMALTEEELYRHMSDKDYVGRFASPARTTFKLLFEKEELIRRAVSSSADGVEKLTIPRNTEFRVSDYIFTMEYPIELRVMGHGGIQVVYDVSQTSPLRTIESNAVDWSLVRIQGREFVQVEVPVDQFELTTHYANINQSTGYIKHFKLKNHFYYCRVYRERTNGEWEEIKTTHTDQVFDPFEPTVVLKVIEDKLQVTIPHVYIHSGVLDRELRIDIYTTKGPLDVILDNYEINAFSVNWREAGRDGLDRYSAPLSVFTTMAVFSDSAVTGGSKPLGFRELRERVIMNALGNANLPITNVQLTGQLANLGYRAIKDVDNITNRIFLASRQLPAPSSGSSVSGPGCYFGKIQATFADLTYYDEVVDNGNRITLTPDLLYKRDNGITEPLSRQDREAVEALEGEAFLQEVNANAYLYSPFHYVLDSGEGYFDSRVYYLDAPQIVSRQFVAENDQLGMQVNSQRVRIEKCEDGYRLRLVTNSDEVFKELEDDDIRVQISYRPRGESRAVYQVGELIGRNDDDERIYEFHLQSNFDVDPEHALALTNFAMYPDEFRAYHTPLENDFDIAFFVSGLNTDEIDSTEIDYVGSSFIIDPDSVGLIHEQVRIRFGRHMEGFWNNARSIVSSRTHKTYEEDVQALYEQNIYERDENGNIKIELDENGEIDYKLLHKAGDPVYDSEGEPVYKHRKGDPVVDSEGNPVYSDERGILREFETFLVDGRYYFANHEDDQAYRKELPETLISWLLDDIAQFRNWTLEKTDIFLYIQPTMGPARAYVEENEPRTIELEQSVTVTFYQDRNKYNDLFVRQTLNDLTAEVLTEAFSERRVTRSEIIRTLTERAGEDIIAAHVEGLGGEDFSTFTLRDDAERCSVAKRLDRTADGFYQVVDDINIVFLLHEG